MIKLILFWFLFLVFTITALECCNDKLIKGNKQFCTLYHERKCQTLRLHRGRERLLRIPSATAVNECHNAPGSNITKQTLGPSYEYDSLYNNVPFESVIAGHTIDNNSDDGSMDTLPMNKLTSALVENILLYSEASKFVQENEYFGRRGEYTEEMLSQHQLFMDYWQLTNDPPILLVGVHSEILELKGNLETAVAVLSYMNEYQSDLNVTNEIRIVAAQARLAIETELPNDYSNNDLTPEDGYFVANFGVVGYENSSVIVAGDGAIYFHKLLGYDAVGSDILHAHEFGHAIQHILDLEDVNGDFDLYLENYANQLSPESNRYSELEADAMAAYALAHRQGRNFPMSLLFEATKAAFTIGDCAYDSNDHHGSPQQRECATKWGADEGLDMVGTPLSPREFRNRFTQSYEKILTLDSTVCQFTDDIGDDETPVSPPTNTIIKANNTFLPNISNDEETVPPNVSSSRILSTSMSLVLLLLYNWTMILCLYKINL